MLSGAQSIAFWSKFTPYYTNPARTSKRYRLFFTPFYSYFGVIDVERAGFCDGAMFPVFFRGRVDPEGNGVVCLIGHPERLTGTVSSLEDNLDVITRALRVPECRGSDELPTLDKGRALGFLARKLVVILLTSLLSMERLGDILRVLVLAFWTQGYCLAVTERAPELPDAAAVVANIAAELAISRVTVSHCSPPFMFSLE
jgi:hypothetical protein